MNPLIEIAGRKVGYEPRVSLEEGIRKIIKVGVLQSKWATSERRYTIDDYV